jgi:hypothetical protein
VVQKSENTSNLETFLSCLILTVLIVTATGIFLTHFTLNPAVESLEIIKSSAQAPLPAEKPSPKQLLFSLPESLVALSLPELFGSESLSDKINGKAELYLSAGFVRLQTQRFKARKESKVWIEVFVYDMGAHQNAFSVFSAQRRDDAQSLILTRYSYQTPNALYFVHGIYYVEIIASTAAPESWPPMQSFASAFIESVAAETKSITAEDLFPETDLVQSSISLISSDAFGFDRFDQVYTAAYRLEGAEVTAFFSDRTSAQEAAKLAQAYYEFLLAFDGREVETNLSIKDAKMVEILETYEIIFSRGPYFAGIREAEDKDIARELAMRLNKKLSEVTDGP